VSVVVVGALLAVACLGGRGPETCTPSSNFQQLAGTACFLLPAKAHQDKAEVGQTSAASCRLSSLCRWVMQVALRMSAGTPACILTHGGAHPAVVEDGEGGTTTMVEVGKGRVVEGGGAWARCHHPPRGRFELDFDGTRARFELSVVESIALDLSVVVPHHSLSNGEKTRRRTTGARSWLRLRPAVAGGPPLLLPPSGARAMSSAMEERVREVDSPPRKRDHNHQINDRRSKIIGLLGPTLASLLNVFLFLFSITLL
jgi:hypothetical protein